MAREPEVAEVDVVTTRGVCQEDVRRLDVAMHEVLGMRGVERPGHAIDDRRRACRPQGAAQRVEQAAQIRALDDAMYGTPSASPIA